MDKDRIKELLDRFYEGTSTREEEELLTHYFAQEEEVPEEWSTEKEMFRQMADMRHTLSPIPSGLEERLGRQIDHWAEAERESARLRHPHRRRMWWSAGIAACLLLAGSIGLKMMQPTTDAPQPADLTPEMALAETERALQLFSTTLNKGVKQVAMARQTTQQVQESINRTLNHIKQ